MSTGLIEFYPQIKAVHISCVLASGSLFAIRGAAVLSGARWPLALPVRWLSYAIDTTLLTAALMLLTILPWAVFGNGWLAMKLMLVVVYVVLATFALRALKTPDGADITIKGDYFADADDPRVQKDLVEHGRGDDRDGEHCDLGRDQRHRRRDRCAAPGRRPAPARRDAVRRRAAGHRRSLRAGRVHRGQ